MAALGVRRISGSSAILIAIMLLDDLLETTGKALIRLRLLLQHIPRKDHVVLVLLHHLGHAFVGRSTNARHG